VEEFGQGQGTLHWTPRYHASTNERLLEILVFTTLKTVLYDQGWAGSTPE